MKIFDCFMFFDEEMLLDFRLSYLNSYVDKFIIVESQYSHSGEKKKLLFDMKKYQKFKDKIVYIVVDKEPINISKVLKDDDDLIKNSKYILNAAKRENFQRNCIQQGLMHADSDDLILISDLDEIPNLENINLNDIKNNLIFFKQKLYYYKFNLKLDSFKWYGTKACRMKNLISPQWLRNIKDKKYPFWRIDTIFSKTKYHDIFFVENGGWHFSYMKTAKNIEKKLSSYLHHREYDLDPLGKDKILEMMNKKEPVYNLNADMKTSKFSGGQELIISDIKELPIYIQKNANKYKEWLE